MDRVGTQRGGSARLPWNLPVVRHLDRMEFRTPVTFLVGENGIGKSTLIEAIAVAAGINPEGGTRNLRFTARQTESPLHERLILAWRSRPTHTSFLRAETFFNMASAYEEIGDPSMGDLHERSHGQQFLDTVRNRFGPGGLFLMDEPESALSFTSELALLHAMGECAALGSQFIVATHSPILVACPGATILLLDEDTVSTVELEETPQFRNTRAFLNSPQQPLRHLFEHDDGE